MQKEEKIVIILLLMALGSLAVAFWAFGPEDEAAKSPFESASLNAGLSVEGIVTEITPKKGDRVRVKGIQKEFQGQKEIEVSRSSDVSVIN